VIGGAALDDAAGLEVLATARPTEGQSTPCVLVEAAVLAARKAWGT
jgi:hypothetical protein